MKLFWNILCVLFSWWLVGRWLVGRLRPCQWFRCWWLVGRCRTCQWVGGQLLVTGGLFEDCYWVNDQSSMGRWRNCWWVGNRILVVGGLLVVSGFVIRSFLIFYFILWISMIAILFIYQLQLRISLKPCNLITHVISDG